MDNTSIQLRQVHLCEIDFASLFECLSYHDPSEPVYKREVRAVDLMFELRTFLPVFFQSGKPAAQGTRDLLGFHMQSLMR